MCVRCRRARAEERRLSSDGRSVCQSGTRQWNNNAVAGMGWLGKGTAGRPMLGDGQQHSGTPVTSDNVRPAWQRSGSSRSHSHPRPWSAFARAIDNSSGG